MTWCCSALARLKRNDHRGLCVFEEMSWITYADGILTWCCSALASHSAWRAEVRTWFPDVTCVECGVCICEPCCCVTNAMSNKQWSIMCARLYFHVLFVCACVCMCVCACECECADCAQGLGGSWIKYSRGTYEFAITYNVIIRA